MGNDLSSIPWKGESGVDIMGQDDTIQEITSEEQQILNDTSEAFHKFYTNPFTNYQILSPHKSIYLKAHGKNFELYQWIIEKTHFGDEKINLDYELEIDRLLDPRNFLSFQDLNKLWILYYATGHTVYTDRIKHTARNPLVNEDIRNEAMSSYNTNIKQGYLIDNDFHSY